MINNNELTLSKDNRYFLHTPVQCIDENGKLQTQSVLIDNITDNSLWNMNTEKLKCSLLSTSINQMSVAKKGDSLSSANTEKCRSVSVYTDATKNEIISGYITLEDYKNLDPVAVLNSSGAKPLAPGSIPLAPGSMPLAPGSIPLAPGSIPLAPGSMPLAPGGPQSPTPGATPEPTQNLGDSLNNYLNPSTENFSTSTNETNAFHKIRNNSVLRFYFISLLVIFIYILYRIYNKMFR